MARCFGQILVRSRFLRCSVAGLSCSTRRLAIPAIGRLSLLLALSLRLALPLRITVGIPALSIGTALFLALALTLPGILP
jgi:hypothetical protein